MPDCQPDQIKRSTFISFGESRARSNSGGGKKEDLVTLAFLSFFLVCCMSYIIVSQRHLSGGIVVEYSRRLYMYADVFVYIKACASVCV